MAGGIDVSARIHATLASVDLHDQRSGGDFTPANSSVSGDDLASGRVTDLVGFYFGAGWCPPCRRFSPELSRFAVENEKDFSAVLVSADNSATEGHS